MSMDIIFIASEISPFVKVGGLSDVVFGLCAELNVLGHRTEVILPKYRSSGHVHYERVNDLTPSTDVPTFESVYGGFSKKWYVETGTVSDIRRRHEIKVSLLDCREPPFDPWHVYPQGSYASILCFNRAALDYILTLRLRCNRSPDILHLNDWSSALVAPLYYQEFYEKGMNTARVVLTIHNAAEICQGTVLNVADVCAAFTRAVPPQLMYPNKHDLGEHAILLKGGIEFADKVVIVSPTYKAEMLADRSLTGERLYDIVMKHQGKLGAVLNGIDYAEWDPATDPLLTVHYSRDDDENVIQERKRQNKNELRKMLKLPIPDAYSWNDYMVGCVARLTEQKGVHLILHCVGWAHRRGVQLVILGSSQDDPNLWKKVSYECSFGPNVRVVLHQDDKIVHHIFSGSDAFIVPSKFEPCGLTQLISFRYGTPPIVRAVGGLKDTVVEGGPHHNGFVFWYDCVFKFEDSLERAFTHWRASGHRAALFKKVMNLDHSWKKPAIEYVDIYKSLMAKASSTRSAAFQTIDSVSAFQFTDGTEHVFYCTRNGRVGDYMRNFKTGGEKWGHTDLMTAVGLQHGKLNWEAAGTPLSYFSEEALQFVYYRDEAGNIHMFVDSKRGDLRVWAHYDVTTLPECGPMPKCKSPLTGFSKTVNRVVEHHLFFIDSKGHLITVFTLGPGTGWRWMDLHFIMSDITKTRIAKGTGRVCAFKFPGQEHRLLFRGLDGHVYSFATKGIRWNVCEDLTRDAPPLSHSPSIYVDASAPEQEIDDFETLTERVPLGEDEDTSGGLADEPQMSLGMKRAASSLSLALQAPRSLNPNRNRQVPKPRKPERVPLPDHEGELTTPATNGRDAEEEEDDDQHSVASADEVVTPDTSGATVDAFMEQMKKEQEKDSMRHKLVDNLGRKFSNTNHFGMGMSRIRSELDMKMMSLSVAAAAEGVAHSRHRGLLHPSTSTVEGAVATPGPLGSPSVLLQSDRFHMAYVSESTVYFIYQDGKLQWNRTDLLRDVGLAGKVKAVGNVSTLVVQGKDLLIFYRDEVGHISLLSSSPKGWLHQDLTAKFRTALAATDPFVYLESSTGTVCVYYGAQPDGSVAHLRFSQDWGTFRDLKSDITLLLAYLS